MKKILVLVILGLMILSVSLVSAVDVTTITGTVFNEETSEVVPGATVTAICTHEGTPYESEEYESDDFGVYFINFDKAECDLGDEFVVSAHTENLAGESDVGTVDKILIEGWNFGIVDVSVIPEFGLFIGALTLVACIGIFFFVRR